MLLSPKYIKDWEVEMNHQDMLKILVFSRASGTPEYQCRFVWKDNSIAFWDNRSCPALCCLRLLATGSESRKGNYYWGSS